MMTMMMLRRRRTMLSRRLQRLERDEGVLVERKQRIGVVARLAVVVADAERSKLRKVDLHLAASVIDALTVQRLRGIRSNTHVSRERISLIY